MTRLNVILAGICTGLIALGMLGAGVWYYVLADDGPGMLNRKWYVSGIEHLRGEVPPGDNWQFPRSSLLEPRAWLAKPGNSLTRPFSKNGLDLLSEWIWGIAHGDARMTSALAFDRL